MHRLYYAICRCLLMALFVHGLSSPLVGLEVVTSETPNKTPFPADYDASNPIADVVDAEIECNDDVSIPHVLGADTDRLVNQIEASIDNRETDRTTSPAEQDKTATPAILDLQAWLAPNRIGSSLQIALTMAVLSLAPAILLMTTAYIRISIVLNLLRQAFGAQQIPSNQVTSSVALFMTMLVMWPTWSRVYEDSIQPYSDPDVSMTWQEAWHAGIGPIRQFMIHQIEANDNASDVILFTKHLPGSYPVPTRYEQVPTQALLPAFVLSELKTAFLIGFQIYLPFLVVDLVVATVTTSMGMVMLPPTMISLPLKLLLFVLADGWNLVIGMLLQSFGSIPT